MNPTIHALRAITALFFRRIARPIVIIASITLGLLFILTIYLGGWVHPAWWLLLLALIPIALIMSALTLGLWYLSGRLLPRKLTTAEGQQVHRFIDKLVRVAEVRATPLPLMVFFIAKDIVRGRKSTYVEEVIRDTTSLKQDMADLRKLFNRTGE